MTSLHQIATSSNGEDSGPSSDDLAGRTSDVMEGIRYVNDEQERELLRATKFRQGAYSKMKKDLRDRSSKLRCPSGLSNDMYSVPDKHLIPLNKMLRDRPDSDDESPKLDGLMWDVNDTPPWHQIVLLGFLHFFVVISHIAAFATYVVPKIGGGEKEKSELIMNTLFISGISTLAQLLVGIRLPVVMGCSNAYLIPILNIADSIPSNAEKFQRTMRLVQGSLIAASLFQFAIGFGVNVPVIHLPFRWPFQTIWWPRPLKAIWSFVDPITMVPMVALSGLGLILSSDCFPPLLSCPWIGLSTLVLLIFLSQSLPHMLRCKRNLFTHEKYHLQWMLKINYQIFPRYAILMCVVLVWPISAVISNLNVYNHSPYQDRCDARKTWMVGQLSGFKVPSAFPWGRPMFRIGDAVAMITAALVATVESTSALIAASRFSGATLMPYSVLERGIYVQGLSNLFCSMFGLTGCTASVENVGLIGLTRAGSRKIVFAAAGFMIVCSTIDFFGKLFASVPLSIAAAWFLVLNGCVASVGGSFIQLCNANHHRTLFIIGVALGMGVSVPEHHRRVVHTGGTWLNNVLQVTLLSHVTVAFVVGICLDAFMRRNRRSKRCSGYHARKRFVVYKSSERSKRYYAISWWLNFRGNGSGGQASGGQAQPIGLNAS